MSAAQIYAPAAGLLLFSVGMAGFLVEPQPRPGELGDAGELLGVLAVSRPQSALFLLIGLAGLASSTRAPRGYALAGGGLMLLLGLAGLAAAGGLGQAKLWGLFAVDSAGNLMICALGIAGLAAGVLSGPGGSRRR